MFELLPSKTNFNFIGRRHLFVGISAVAVIASLVLLFTKGLNLGIDFKGGAEVQLRFKQTMEIGDLRSTLEDAGIKNLVIQQLGDPSTNEFLVKMGADTEESSLQKVGETVEAALAGKVEKGSFEIERVDVVGPQAGAELRKGGILSMFYALICIFLYVALRFDSRYGPGAVISLIHDSIIMGGVFVITQKEFTLQTLAAILTIIGYSINDTIIVFDRIRENLANHPGKPLEELVNTSVNETLSRSIITSLLTFFVAAALMVFGGSVISDFAFALCVGIIAGSYSTIFVASPIMIWVAKWQNKSGKSGGKIASAGAVTRP